MLTALDLFSGAGGAGTGIEATGAVVVDAAVNHLPEAVATYRDNHPNTNVDCADISQVSPRRYRRTDILWASPSCTHHSKARGRHRQDTSLFDEPAGDDVAERSRATMWDVVRFAEHHLYRAIIVENVVEVRDWVMWPAWRLALDLLGYEVRVVYLNSMHAAKLGPPAPQSRDRMYVVCWRRGERAPDLDRWTRPTVHCTGCDRTGLAVQGWKRLDRQFGTFGRNGQYWWRCPTMGCHRIVTPEVLAAASVIDWANVGGRIGERTKPLKPAPLRRITADLDRLGVVDRSRPVAERHMVVPYYSNGRATLATAPIPTIPTHDRFALVSRDSFDAAECTYRMLTVAELKAGMAFPAGYRLSGRPDVQKLMIGNAVTPPAARDLIAALVEAITGDHIEQTA